MDKCIHRSMPTPKQMADWCVDTCLTFGTTVSTAYKVAGLLAEALEDSGRMVASKELKPPLEGHRGATMQL